MTAFKVRKVITNNIVRAMDINDKEVILIGKGIGFSKKSNDIIPHGNVENIFILQDEHEKSLYEHLLKTTSPKLIELSNEVISYIQKQVSKPLNDHIHIALTDHIAFMVRRCKMGIPVDNPFSFETEWLYPDEYKIAKKVIEMLSRDLNLNIPQGEISFVTLHIVSSLTNDTMLNIQKHSYLISKLLYIIEEEIMTPLDKTSLNYVRLVTHLRFAIERIQRKEVLKTPLELNEILKKNYPQCYSLAYKLVKIMQQELHTHINTSEEIYLAMHLYRFVAEW